MNINVWQAEALAAAMRQHDDPNKDLDYAYADVEVVTVDDTENAAIVKIRWEDGARLVLGDGYANNFTDQTERYASRQDQDAR